MKIIYNNILPFGNFAAINLFGVFFVKRSVVVDEQLIRHERIHTAQMKELCFLFFYLWYLLEWLVKLLRYGKRSYYNICFEREAYANHNDKLYLQQRKKYSFLKYLRNSH